MAESGQNGVISWNRLGYRFNGEGPFKRVTTIKNMKGGSSALVDWAAGMVATKAQGIGVALRDGAITSDEAVVALLDERLAKAHNEARDTAADFGTVFHALVEDIAAGDQSALDLAERRLDDSALVQFAAARGVDFKDGREKRLYEQRLSPNDRENLAADRAAFKERLWPDVEAFFDWCDRLNPKWIRNEFQVFNRAIGYAGSVDALVEVGGCRMLVDVKTSKTVYWDYQLQLAAYRYAEFIGEPDGRETPVPEVDGAAVLHVRDGKCELFEVPADEAAFDGFKACATLYRLEAARKKAAPAVFQPRLFSNALEEAFA